MYRNTNFFLTNKSEQYSNPFLISIFYSTLLLESFSLMTCAVFENEYTQCKIVVWLCKLPVCAVGFPIIWKSQNCANFTQISVHTAQVTAQTWFAQLLTWFAQSVCTQGNPRYTRSLNCTKRNCTNFIAQTMESRGIQTSQEFCAKITAQTVCAI